MTEQEKFEAWFSENGYNEQHREMFEIVWQAAIASRGQNPMPPEKAKEIAGIDAA